MKVKKSRNKILGNIFYGGKTISLGNGTKVKTPSEIKLLLIIYKLLTNM
jgi:hypothetical protein